MTVEERALAYALALPPAISGSDGHGATIRVASALVWGFGLDREQALGVMREWNRQRAEPPWSEDRLAYKIDSASRSPSKYGKGYLLRDKPAEPDRRNEGVAPEPRGEDRPRIPVYDPKEAERYASGCRALVTLDRLAECSPVPVPAPGEQTSATAETFLSALYRDGERVLVFTDFRSQGDFLWTVGDGGSRLSRRRDVAPVSSRLPGRGTNGVWFLIQPVTGEWAIQGGGESAKYGRRHGACVTSWRYLLLESDDAPESVWLRCLVQLPLRIVALYTSGGRSVHALVKVNADSKAEHDSCRNVIRSVLPVLGADPAAMTGVRLSRLPGCYRGDRLQRLVWLDPEPPEGISILDRITL
jgi:hypothetical protein